MSDLIRRADAIEAVCRTRCGDKAKGCPAHSCLVIEEFDSIPSAETHEIRTETHGVCLISKDDAMGAVQDHFNANGFKGYDDGQKMMDRIKALPSADAEQGWIPIKDGLPKPYKHVMATVWFEDDGDDDDAFEIAFGFLNKFGKWGLRLADGCECIKGFYVQAWQPLPKPYECGARMKGGDDK